MEKVVLITGSESILGHKLVEKELKRGNRVIAPVASKSSSSTESSREDLLVIPWNRSSVFSTKALIREALRFSRTIDKIIILSPAGSDSAFPLEMKVREIDEFLDSNLIGQVYLIREIIQQMNQQPECNLAFAMAAQDKGRSMMKGCQSFFHSLADGILEESKESLKTCGFLSDWSDMEGYADFIVQFSDEIPQKARGEWLKYSQKKGLFNQLPIEKRRQS